MKRKRQKPVRRLSPSGKPSVEIDWSKRVPPEIKRLDAKLLPLLEPYLTDDDEFQTPEEMQDEMVDAMIAAGFFTAESYPDDPDTMYLTPTNKFAQLMGTT